jgi:hypothetical protein
MAALSYAGMIRIRFEGCISARGNARAPPGRRAASMDAGEGARKGCCGAVGAVG